MTTDALVVDVAQGTDPWLQARCGKLTGTRAADMLATIKSGEAAARRDLRLTMVVEKMTGRPQEDRFVSADMQWGKDHEAEARRAYEAASGEVVQQIGFLVHRELAVGCSPDGVIAGGLGLLELKCPRSAQHLKSIRSAFANGVQPEYLPQIRHNLWVSGAQWCDFCSYDPRFPRALRLVVVRVDMPAVERYAYELVVRRFLSEVETEYDEVQSILHSVTAGGPR